MQKHQLQWKADWLAAHHSAQPAIDASFCAECSETQPPPSSAAASGATTSTPTTSTASASTGGAAAAAAAADATEKTV